MAPAGSKSKKATQEDRAQKQESIRKAHAQSSGMSVVGSGRAWVMKYMKEHPQEIVHIRSHLDEGLHLPKKGGTNGAAEAEYWHDTYMNFKSIPKYWLASLMVKVGAEFGLTTAVVDAIDAADKHFGIRRLTQFLFAVGENTYLPRPCLNKDICQAFMISRGKRLGERWKTVAKNLVSDNHELLWEHFGVYEAVWTGDRVTGIRHRSLRVEAEIKDLIVSKDGGWSMECNWSDVKCILTNELLKLNCRDFFQGTSGFFEEFGNASLKKAADECAKKYEEDKKERKLDADTDILATNAAMQQRLMKQRRASRTPPPRGALLVPALSDRVG